ncbi:hypothetical protein [Gillisia sp. JM1]|nr:hypothetical protein [Gillisia sp. JM1]
MNFQDFNACIFGRPDGIKKKFVLNGSLDGKNWEIIADYSKNEKDMPHA